MPNATDPIDRDLYIARAGRPHNRPIGHLTESHSLPATGNYLFQSAARAQEDPDTRQILAALRAYRDADPASPTFACYQWYVEDTAVCDTNASFFICTPLAGLWLGHREALTEDELVELKGVFSDALPWFERMARSPSLFYPNKCISDAGMLLAAGHVLGDPDVIESGRAFAHRYFDYYRRRGTGWGEDHSPVYTRVIIEMTLLIMALERDGSLYDKARDMTDRILDWVAFHDGVDAVPSIRGYNFGRNIRVDYQIARLMEGVDGDLPPMLDLLKRVGGYSYTPEPLSTPRQRRWRTFDQHFSTSYIDTNARLGTLSHYPLMPNSYMHDQWGLGWQSKPCSFIVGEQDYGVLEWVTEDDEGIVRRHELSEGFHDWRSRHLFKRASFHPDVVFVGHQEKRAAIVLRELHRVHSPTRRVADQWRVTPGVARVLIEGKPWDGGDANVPPGWVVLEYEDVCVAIHPLECRTSGAASDDPNLQRRATGNIRDVSVHVSRTDNGLVLALPLHEADGGVLTEHLLFSGWCIVLLDKPEDVASLHIAETFEEDGEVPRTYGELIRTIKLTTPDVELQLTRDMLTGRTQRFTA